MTTAEAATANVAVADLLNQPSTRTTSVHNLSVAVGNGLNEGDGPSVAQWVVSMAALAELVRRAEEVPKKIALGAAPVATRSAYDTLREAVAKTSAEVDTMLGLPNDIARREGYLAGLEAAVCVLEFGEMPDEVRHD